MILVEWSAPFLMHTHSQVSADLYEGDGARPHEEDRHCNSEGERYMVAAADYNEARCVLYN